MEGNRNNRNSPTVKASPSSSSRVQPAPKRRRRVGTFNGWTVCFVLSPKSSFQASIWESSLATPRMGAAVVSDLSDAPSSTEHIVVVTDKESAGEANRRLSSSGRAAVVVDKDWCLKSISKNQPLNPDRFRVYVGSESQEPVDSCNVQPDSVSPSTQSGDWSTYRWISGSTMRSVWNPHLELSLEQKQSLARSAPSCALMRARCNPELIPNPNAGLISALRLLAKKRHLTLEWPENDMKALVYNRAAAAIAILPFKVTSANDIEGLSGIGGPKNELGMPEGISAKIAEYCRTDGRVAELEEYHTNAELRLLRDLTPVYGMSAKLIKELWHGGKKSIQEVVDYYHHKPNAASTQIVRLALDAHVAQKTPLSRSEACSVRTRVLNLVRTKFSAHNFIVKLCGGFRRGNREGHDIDLLYTVAGGGGLSEALCTEFKEALKFDGIISTVLTGDGPPGRHDVHFHQREKSAGVQSKYEVAHDVMMCLVSLPCSLSPRKAKDVRVDFVGVLNEGEWPFATLAWSGSTQFQRELRRYATHRLGMTFNAHGLFFESNGARVPLSPACRTEHDVFSALQLNYLAPYERCL